MKTAREFFETHRGLHERFKADKIMLRTFEAAIAMTWDEIRAASLEREVGELIIADIRRAMAETRTMLATEEIRWQTADGQVARDQARVERTERSAR